MNSREFPSLSTNQQQQYSNPGQAVWANQRPGQHATTIQRPQHSQQAAPGAAPGSQASHQGQDHTHQRMNDDFFSSNLSGRLDDFRHGNPSALGQLPSSSNPQPESVDDFPPLSRIGPGEIGQDRRMAMLQSAASSGFPGGSGLASGQINT